MIPGRWHEVEDLYHAAADLTPAARAALLEGTDPELRKEVESLLLHLGPLPDIGVTLPGSVSEVGVESPRMKPGDRLGAYRIEARLSAGGMGEIYRAHDTQLERAVAIKILLGAQSRDPDRIARFEREARALASLNHPNIAQVYGIAESNEARGIAMELVPGANIAGPLPIEIALGYAKQIASALEAAHERGIIHRDLKPANIMVRPDGVVKLLDFGLARLSMNPMPPDTDSMPPAWNDESPAMMASPTRVGIILGTAPYMAPEQARGKVVDKRADIWAFGAVLYEITTGKRLFVGDTVTDILAAILKEEPDLTLAPQGIRRLLAACLTKDPAKRLRDIADWERLIEAERAPTTANIVRRGKRKAALAALTAVALGLIAFAAINFRRKEAAGPSIRLTMSLPNSVAAVSFLALSPDGRTVLLSITDKDAARSGLALRSLDSDQLRLLPATSGAREPFWSPDGKRIAFSKLDGKLRIMSAAGGPAEVVFEGSGCGCGGGAWGSGGVILISDSNNQFQRCDADRPRCKPLAADPSLKRTSPSFLPDGKHFLFTVTDAGLDTAAANRLGIYVGSLDDPNGKRLMPDVSKAIYSQDAGGGGFLILRRGQTLAAQAFDPRSLTLSGPVFTVAEDVGRDASMQTMASAGVNGSLIYQTGRSVNAQLTWLNRSGKVLSVAGPLRNQHAVALSPRANQILVTRGPLHSDDQGLWLRETTRDIESRLVAPPLSGEAAVWSPDGRMVAFTGQDGDLYRMDISSGAKEELILKDGVQKRASDWSRDGHLLLFTETDLKTNADIWVLPEPAGAAGAGKAYPFQRTDAIESEGRISPDGKWIAYSSNESGSYEVYVRPFPSGAGRWKVSTRSGREPQWRGDGRELFYWAEKPPGWVLMAAPIQTTASNFFAAGEPRPLFEQKLFRWIAAFNYSTYSASADGQSFLVLSQPDGQETIHVLYNWTHQFPARP